MRTGRTNVAKRKYEVVEKMVETVLEKDLGITVDSKLNFEYHVAENVRRPIGWWVLLGEYSQLWMRRCSDPYTLH